MRVREIMQVGVGVPDREKFESFARDMLGFPVLRSPDGRISYVRTDQYRHRIAAITALEPVLRYVSFDIGGSEQLAGWASKLNAAGIAFRCGTPVQCVERGVSEFIEFKDPDGHVLVFAVRF
jgi:catechol 2,3-dioxygenase-like lactoylglutathione lyase family enzyme